MNSLPSRWFTWNIKFSLKIIIKKNRLLPAAILLGTLRVKMPASPGTFDFWLNVSVSTVHISDKYFSYFSMKTFCRYPFEVPCRGTHMFLRRNKKNIYLWTLKAPNKTYSRWHLFLFFYFFKEKSLDISCESSAKQMIHMKCQDLFSLKKKKKKKKIQNVVCCNCDWRFKG